MKLRDKIIKGTLISILLIAIFAVIYLVVIHNPGQEYTEFYILDSNHNSTDYPTNMTLHSTEKIFIGVQNQEHDNVNYTIKIYQDDILLKTYNMTLDNHEKKEITYYVNANKIGEAQDLEFKLYKNNITNVYRSLKLKYNVFS